MRKLIARCVAVLMLAGLAVVLPTSPAKAVGDGIDITTAPPWATFIAVKYKKGSICSGTLIGIAYVLTARHCVYENQTNKVPVTAIRVIFGRNNVLQPKSPGVEMQVAQIFPAPDGSDIAVLKLAGPALPSTALPMPLAPTGALPDGGTQLTAYGYGHTQETWDKKAIKGFDPTSPNLPEEPARYTSSTYLRRTKAGSYEVDASCQRDRLICLKKVGASEVMGGDSGGPWVRDDTYLSLTAVHSFVAKPVITSAQTVSYQYAAAVPVTHSSIHSWIAQTAGIYEPSVGSILRSAADGSLWYFSEDRIAHPVGSNTLYSCLTRQGHTTTDVSAFKLAEVPRTTTPATCSAITADLTVRACPKGDGDPLTLPILSGTIHGLPPNALPQFLLTTGTLGSDYRTYFWDLTGSADSSGTLAITDKAPDTYGSIPFPAGTEYSWEIFDNLTINETPLGGGTGTAVAC